MSYLEQRYPKRARSKRKYIIDDKLYADLKALSETYEASATELVNAAMEFLIETENISLIAKEESNAMSEHSLLIRESNIVGFEKLKDKYGVNVGKLVNIAIKNLIEDSGI